MHGGSLLGPLACFLLVTVRVVTGTGLIVREHLQLTAAGYGISVATELAGVGVHMTTSEARAGAASARHYKIIRRVR
jgi:hypothetical protein